MSDPPAYTISVLCYNRRGMTERCVRSILTHSPEATEIIATDNGSTDGTADLLHALAAEDGRLQVVVNATNRGVSAPKREACERARAPLFVSLDNDAWVGPGWLDALRGPLDVHHAVAQVGRSGQHQALRHDGIGQPNGPVEYIDGSCFMTRTAVANEIGLCDRFFPFAYGDDADYSLRLRARGWQIAVVEGAPIWHPQEHEKQGHGGIDMAPHLSLAQRRMVIRWKDYLRRRAFDPTILIRRSAAVGDVVMATALPRLIKTMWPQARIFFSTLLPDLVRGNPYIEGIVAAHEYPSMAPRMAYGWDLDGVYEAQLGRPYWKSYAEATMFAPEDPTPPGDLWPTPAAEAEAEALVGPEPERLAVVAPQATGWPGKDIGPGSWDGAVRELQARGWHVVEVGRHVGATTVADESLAGRTTLLGLAAVFKRARLFLGLDSGPFHMARAMGCPAVVFFGCTHPHVVSEGHPALWPVRAPNLSCLGCHHGQPPGTTSFRGCARGDLACLGLPPTALAEATVAAVEHIER